MKLYLLILLLCSLVTAPIVGLSSWEKHKLKVGCKEHASFAACNKPSKPSVPKLPKEKPHGESATAVPELDAGGALLAAGLLGSIILVGRERRKKQSA